MSCRRVKESVSPSGRAASVATIFSWVWPGIPASWRSRTATAAPKLRTMNATRTGMTAAVGHGGGIYGGIGLIARIAGQC
jgi:hypothetical protein